MWFTNSDGYCGFGSEILANAVGDNSIDMLSYTEVLECSHNCTHGPSGVP
jgi:hypothetical protein